MEKLLYALLFLTLTAVGGFCIIVPPSNLEYVLGVKIFGYFLVVIVAPVSILLSDLNTNYDPSDL